MDLKISSPCPMRWESLTGNDRIRYCGQCRLNVYNLAGMGKEEVENLFRTSKGRVCGRIYLRGDRTATLRDCSGGRWRVIRRRILYTVAGACVVVFGLVCRSFSGPDLSGLPKWAQDIARWIGPEAPQQGRFEMGVVCPPRVTPKAGP